MVYLTLYNITLRAYDIGKFDFKYTITHQDNNSYIADKADKVDALLFNHREQLTPSLDKQ